MSDENNRFYLNNYFLKKFLKIILIALCFVFFDRCADCQAVTVSGSGSSSDPYIVSNFNKLEYCLENLARGNNNFTYVAVTSTIVIQKKITVESGRFRIYASGGSKTIKRGTDSSYSINENNSAKICFVIEDGAELQFGYKENDDYVLTFNGMKGDFSSKMNVKAAFNVQEGGKLVIAEQGSVYNAANTAGNGTGIILAYGDVVLKGCVQNCDGDNGAAVKVDGGNLSITSTALISGCNASSEGGGVFCENEGAVTMSGGTIRNCSAGEEGGGIFICGEGSTCSITSGTISGNSSGNSGGGIFSGIGAELIIGSSGGSGPVISGNFASGNGGGIRCNGGESGSRGGTTKIYGGTITGNESLGNSGGISCGPEDAYTSRFHIENTTISGNSSAEEGGGIRIPANVNGLDGTHVKIYDCVISSNNTADNGGGLYLGCTVELKDNEISDNTASGKGGGVYITENGYVYMSTGTTSGNYASGRGNGIFLKGVLKVRGGFCVDSGNDVYLASDKYIEVTSPLTVTSGYVAVINSAGTSNGRIIVKVSYALGKGSSELYYDAGQEDEYTETVSKKFLHQGISGTKLLRPTDNVSSMDDCYIVISDRYTISYDANTEAEVSGMPDSQYKFWNEDTKISSTSPSRRFYCLDESKYWNTKKDGTGTVYPGGITYTANSSIKLYAFWLFDEDEVDISIYTGRVRFISEDYLDTLYKRSMWANEYNSLLLETLSKESGEYIYSIEVSGDQIESIRERVQDNGYIITADINKELAGELI